MALASALAGILKPAALVTTPAETDGVELREVKADMRVKVVGLPAEFTAIRMERVGHSPRLGDGRFIRICDYLLVAESETNTQAVFVELKKTKSNGEKPREQLRRSLPLLEYLRSVCEVEHRTTFDRSDISTHYCIVFERNSLRLDKQPVRTEPSRRIQDEEYKDIRVRVCVGTPVSLATLTGE